MRRIVRSAAALAVVLAGSGLAACAGEPPSLEATVATAHLVRGAMATGPDGDGASLARLTPGETLDVAEHGLARLVLDGGASLLCDGSAVTLVDERTLSLWRGRALVEVSSGHVVVVETSAGELRLADASASVDVGDDDEGTVVYVVRGEVSYSGCRDGMPRGVARAG